jgi:antitoxin component of RelBE/YafQ-DinJ toxin-antitoxin module
LDKKNYKATFRLRKDEWEKFKFECKNLGLNASTVIRLFVHKFNKEKNIDLILKDKQN